MNYQENYQEKYFKYKFKYLNLKKILNGGHSCNSIIEYDNNNNNCNVTDGNEKNNEILLYFDLLTFRNQYTESFLDQMDFYLIKKNIPLENIYIFANYKDFESCKYDINDIYKCLIEKCNDISDLEERKKKIIKYKTVFKFDLDVNECKLNLNTANHSFKNSLNIFLNKLSNKTFIYNDYTHFDEMINSLFTNDFIEKIRQCNKVSIYFTTHGGNTDFEFKETNISYDAINTNLFEKIYNINYNMLIIFFAGYCNARKSINIIKQKLDTFINLDPAKKNYSKYILITPASEFIFNEITDDITTAMFIGFNDYIIRNFTNKEDSISNEIINKLLNYNAKKLLNLISNVYKDLMYDTIDPIYGTKLNLIKTINSKEEPNVENITKFNIFADELIPLIEKIYIEENIDNKLTEINIIGKITNQDSFLFYSYIQDPNLKLIGDLNIALQNKYYLDNQEYLIQTLNLNNLLKPSILSNIHNILDKNINEL